jgi:hypothetical protein
MKRLGLAWNVVLITKERQRERLAEAAQQALPGGGTSAQLQQ